MFTVKLEKLWAAIARLKGGREATVVQTCSLTKEVAWRLRQIAQMMNCSPGNIVEVLISDTVKAVRLPWDTVGRVAMGLIPASESGLQSQGSGVNETGEAVGTFESQAISPTVALTPVPGAGEGGETSPAPSPPAGGGKGRPAQTAGRRKAG